MTTSLRACLAAEAWKRLHPEGEGLSKGGRGKKTDSKSGVSFQDFAKSNFKTNAGYANQALAILNHSAELLPVPPPLQK